MGVSDKFHQTEGGVMDNEKWANSGVSLRSPLKPVFTKPLQRNKAREEEEEEELSTTPTSAESRIPSILICPPAPKKRKAASSRSSCHYGRVREFFYPPDLETIFRTHVEGA